MKMMSSMQTDQTYKYKQTYKHRPKHSAFVIIPATVGVSRKTFCHDEMQRGVS